MDTLTYAANKLHTDMLVEQVIHGLISITSYIWTHQANKLHMD